MSPQVFTTGKSRAREFKHVTDLVCSPVELINSFLDWKVAQSSRGAVSYCVKLLLVFWISLCFVGFILIRLMKPRNATLSRKWSEGKLIFPGLVVHILFHCSCCGVGKPLS